MHKIIKFQAWADFHVNFLYHERGPLSFAQNENCVCMLERRGSTSSHNLYLRAKNTKTMHISVKPSFTNLKLDARGLYYTYM